MTATVFLNGRFRSQSVTGVQRFSAEVVSAIDRLMLRGEWPETTLLTPQLDEPADRGGATPYGLLQSRKVGHRSGHAWEQIELPKAAREYLTFIEKESGARIGMVSPGPGREETIFLDEFGAKLRELTGSSTRAQARI